MLPYVVPALGSIGPLSSFLSSSLYPSFSGSPLMLITKLPSEEVAFEGDAGAVGGGV